MLFIEGTNVNAGDPLFMLDDKPYQEKLKAAKGMLAEAQASLKKSETDVARLRPLAEKKAVPQQDLDNALAAVEVGRASVVSAQANVDAAQLDVDYCDIRAPISGLIGAKQVSIGELVGKGEPTLMATISTLDPIWVYCNVSEVGLLDLAEYSRRTGKHVTQAPVTLILANGAEHPEKGKVVFVDRAVDPKTGTLRIRVEFANPSGLLRPGMFARMIVDFGTRPDSILVPQKAVTELQGKYFVWVVGAGNKASQRPVTVVRQIGENLLILEEPADSGRGLKAGERIIVVGLQKAHQDQPVKPMTAAEAAAAQAAQEAEAKQAKEGAAKHGKE
jgi:membrane fusion protein (multidrug efflux system)